METKKDKDFEEKCPDMKKRTGLTKDVCPNADPENFDEGDYEDINDNIPELQNYSSSKNKNIPND